MVHVYFNRCKHAKSLQSSINIANLLFTLGPQQQQDTHTQRIISVKTGNATQMGFITCKIHSTQRVNRLPGNLSKLF